MAILYGLPQASPGAPRRGAGSEWSSPTPSRPRWSRPASEKSPPKGGRKSSDHHTWCLNNAIGEYKMYRWDKFILKKSMNWGVMWKKYSWGLTIILQVLCWHFLSTVSKPHLVVSDRLQERCLLCRCGQGCASALSMVLLIIPSWRMAGFQWIDCGWYFKLTECGSSDSRAWGFSNSTPMTIFQGMIDSWWQSPRLLQAGTFNCMGETLIKHPKNDYQNLNLFPDLFVRGFIFL